MGLVICILGMILAATFFVAYEISWNKLVSNILLILTIVVVGMTIVTLSTLFLSGDRTEGEPSIIEEYTLVSFSDSTEVSGNGSFLHITISTDSVYTFYYQIDNNGYKQGKLVIEDENVTIFETDDVNPTIIKYQRNYNYKYPFVKALWEWEYEYYYEIYVPVGSIVQDFVLDME